MDYEKAYKEALEKAKKNYETAQELSDGSTIGVECFKNTITSIFPELKSEDERIRKFLLHNVEKTIKETFEKEGFKKEDILYWLEKQQGENILIEEIKRRKELYSQEKEKAVSSTEKISLGGRIAMLEELCAFIDVKQGEQKFVDKVEPKFLIGDRC